MARAAKNDCTEDCRKERSGRSCNQSSRRLPNSESSESSGPGVIGSSEVFEPNGWKSLEITESESIRLFKAGDGPGAFNNNLETIYISSSYRLATVDAGAMIDGIDPCMREVKSEEA